MDDMFVTEVGSLKIEISYNVLKDARFARAIGQLNNSKGSNEVKMQAFNRICDLLFGDATDDVMDAIAEEHDGVCDLEIFSVWMTSIFEKMGADSKN